MTNKLMEAAVAELQKLKSQTILEYHSHWTGTVDGKHWVMPLHKHEIGDGPDDTIHRLKQHNKHLSDSEIHAVDNAAGEDGKHEGLNGKTHHVKHEDELKRGFHD